MNPLFIASVSVSNYLSPENPLAAVIVSILKWFFAIWFLGLIGSAIWILIKRSEMKKFRDVAFLAERVKNLQIQTTNEDTKAKQPERKVEQNSSEQKTTTKIAEVNTQSQIKTEPKPSEPIESESTIKLKQEQIADIIMKHWNNGSISSEQSVIDELQQHRNKHGDRGKDIISDQFITDILTQLKQKTEKNTQQDKPIHEITQENTPIKSAAPVKTTSSKIVQEQAPKRENPIQKLCRLYNEAVNDQGKRNEFIKSYNPVQFGVANQMDRTKDPKLEPNFMTTDNGNYYAVLTKPGNLFAVLPCYDLSFFSTLVYVAGAMGSVFDCPGYNPQTISHNIKVIRPAFFETDTNRQKWVLKEKGELSLEKDN